MMTSEGEHEQSLSERPVEEAFENAVQALLERAQLQADPLAWWWAVRNACCAATNAVGGTLYLHDIDAGQLLRLKRGKQRHSLARPVPVMSDEVAAQAARTGESAERGGTDVLREIAMPIFGRAGPARATTPCAIIVLRFDPADPIDSAFLCGRVARLLDEIWPITTYASVRYQASLASSNASATDARATQLELLLDAVLDVLRGSFGFDFALISMVDAEAKQIRAVRGRNVSIEWIREARHSVNSNDIQADVLRTGRAEVVSGWDRRFDRAIWEKYRHSELVRVFVPVGTLGTIEAGWHTQNRGAIEDLLVKVLEHYARTLIEAVQGALLEDLQQDTRSFTKLTADLFQSHQREQRHNEMLTELYRASSQAQAVAVDEDSLVKRLSEAGLSLLGQDALLMLYLPESTSIEPGNAGSYRSLTRRQAGLPLRLAHVAGEIRGPANFRSPVDDDDNVVALIAATRRPYFQTQARTDPLLVGEVTDGQRSSRSLIERQEIQSFAGVPLISGNELLGILCVNFRETTRFVDREQQIIQLFAQQVSAVIASMRMVRTDERRRLERGLHDSVKSSARGLLLLSEEARKHLGHNQVDAALAHLDDICRAAWGILDDINVLLSQFTAGSEMALSVAHLIPNDLQRRFGDRHPKLILDLDPNAPLLPVELTRSLVAVIREAVVNALEHSRAESICVRAREVGGDFQLSVEDDGQGFDQMPKAGGSHRGLAYMAERAREIGAHVDIDSRPGIGTTIRVSVPLGHDRNRGRV